MPIPAGPAGALNPASAVLALFRQLHQQTRGELAGLDDDGVSWVPVPGANPISVIVTHLVGSEAESLRAVARPRGRPGSECRVRSYPYWPRRPTAFARRGRPPSGGHRRAATAGAPCPGGGLAKLARRGVATWDHLADRQLRVRPGAPRPHSAHQASLRVSAGAGPPPIALCPVG